MQLIFYLFYSYNIKHEKVFSSIEINEKLETIQFNFKNLDTNQSPWLSMENNANKFSEKAIHGNKIIYINLLVSELLV